MLCVAHVPGQPLSDSGGYVFTVMVIVLVAFPAALVAVTLMGYLPVVAVVLTVPVMVSLPVPTLAFSPAGSFPVQVSFGTG